MPRYNLNNFLENVNKHIEKAEEGQKKEALGLIIGSLQRPFNDVMNSISIEQGKQVQELYKLLGWSLK